MAPLLSDPAERESGLRPFSLRDLLNVVFKRRRLIIVCCATVFLLAVVSSVLSRPKFRVTATLLVNKSRAEVPLAPMDSRQLIISQVNEQDLNSEIEIFKSRSLIEDVLGSLEIGESQRAAPGLLSQLKSGVKRLLGSPGLSRFDSLVLHLQEKVEISPIRKTNVIRVSYTSEDSDWAHSVVAILTEKYLERRARMYQFPQAVEFFETQMEVAQARLAEDEKTLQNLAEEAAITIVRGPQGSDSLAAQKALVMQRLAGLESDLGNAEVEFQSSLQEVISLRARVDEEPERLASSNRLNQDAATEEIERAIASLVLERDRLLQDFKADSRFVRDVETQIRLAEEQLEEARKASVVNRTETNPVYLQLKSDLLRAEANLERTRARRLSLQKQVREQRSTLEKLNESAFELEQLRRDVQVAEDDYLLYRRKHEEARISAAMDQQKLINVTIAQPAQKPLVPEPQGIMKRLVVALVVGLMGGLGLAFSVEAYVDRSFSTAVDIERGLGIRHLASIPESSQVR